uniref:(northern house mosquito) hypothetical protein n=2 Tax=Culex pipiens TaxID=7175 RepID=A0A8D8BA67_CULPI
MNRRRDRNSFPWYGRPHVRRVYSRERTARRHFIGQNRGPEQANNTSRQNLHQANEQHVQNYDSNLSNESVGSNVSQNPDSAGHLHNHHEQNHQSNESFGSNFTPEPEHNASSECSDSDGRSNRVFHKKFSGRYGKPFRINSELQVYDVLFMVLNFYVRHMPTQQAVEDLLRMLNVIMGCKILPENFHGFMAAFPDTYGAKRIYFCKRCKFRHGIVEPPSGLICPVKDCGSKEYDFFINFPVERQIREIVNKYKNEINDYAQEVLLDNKIKDIRNAGIVQRIIGGSRDQFLTISINTDGAETYECTSKMPLYPVFIVINDLPPRLRFSKENLIVAALWLTRAGEPSMPLLFHDFGNEMRSLRKGMNINGMEYKIVVAQCCADSVCRCKLQNSKQFNGYYGCSFCLHPGQHIDGQVRYPYLDNAVLRTHERTKQHMREAYLNDHEVFGMKGLSVFFDNSGF